MGRHRIAAALVLLLVADGPWPVRAWAAPEAPATRLAEILGRRGSEPFEGRFRQTKFVALLKEPLHSEGTVVFGSDGDLRWEVTTPEPLVVETTAGKVRAGPPGNVQEIPPAALGPFASLPGGFSGVFGATAAEITEAFDVAAGTGAGDFILTPRTPELARALTSIDVSFDPASGLPRRVILRETGGDRSEIEIDPGGLAERAPTSAPNP